VVLPSVWVPLGSQIRHLIEKSASRFNIGHSVSI